MNSFFEKNQLTALSLYLLVAVLPFKLIFFPISLIILLIIFLFFQNKKNIIKVISKQQGIVLLIGFYLVHVFGLFLENSPGIDLEKISLQLPILIIPIILTGFNLTLEQIKKAKQIFVLVCVIFCAIALISLLFNFFINYEHRLNYNFMQRSMYHFHFPYDALYINVATIIVLFDDSFKKYTAWFSFLFFVFILLSGVRVGFFCYGLILTFHVLLNVKKYLNFKSVITLITILIFGLFLIKSSRYVNDKFFDTLNKIGFNTSQYVSEIGEDYHNLSLRQKLWKSSVIALEKSPNIILGYGAQGSREQLNEIYNEQEYLELKELNSHNQYLTTLLNNGALGLLILIYIFTFFLYQSFTAKSFLNVFIVLIIIISFFTESMLERQKGVALFAVFFALISLENRLKIT